MFRCRLNTRKYHIQVQQSFYILSVSIFQARQGEGTQGGSSPSQNYESLWGVALSSPFGERIGTLHGTLLSTEETSSIPKLALSFLHYFHIQAHYCRKCEVGVVKGVVHVFLTTELEARSHGVAWGGKRHP